MPELLIQTRPVYLSARASVLAAKHLAATLQPTKQWRHRSSRHGSAVANVQGKKSTTSSPGLENFSKGSFIPPTLFCSGQNDDSFCPHFLQPQGRIYSLACRAVEIHSSHSSTTDALRSPYHAHGSSNKIAHPHMTAFYSEVRNLFTYDSVMHHAINSLLIMFSTSRA